MCGCLLEESHIFYINYTEHITCLVRIFDSRNFSRSPFRYLETLSTFWQEKLGQTWPLLFPYAPWTMFLNQTGVWSPGHGSVVKQQTPQRCDVMLNHWVWVFECFFVGMQPNVPEVQQRNWKNRFFYVLHLKLHKFSVMQKPKRPWSQLPLGYKASLPPSLLLLTCFY